MQKRANGMKQDRIVKKWIRADDGKLSTVLESESGKCVELPINKDGTIRWFDDAKLLRVEKQMENI